ncbi:MAG: universal stress protein [Deltaproteobacteria bacterium]|nr:universal stress protein [Deltaproteobacteria bacterium]
MIDFPKFTKVLFCTDFSEISDCAFDYAFGIAKRDEGLLYILHVIPPRPAQVYTMEAYLSGEQLEKIDADHREYLKKLFTDKYMNRVRDKAKVKIVVESGREDDKILEFAQKEKVDVIILGTHGRTGVDHVFLGSVAEKVVRRSPLPVFVIPCKDKTCPC